MRRSLSLLLSLSMFLTVLPEGLWAMQNPSTPPTSAQGPGYPTKTPEQLQQLVAPVALYPDPLLAQVLAASTLPVQVVDADRWLQAHTNLKGGALAKAVDQQPWDPSIKGLTAFPSVLGYMDKNLSWTADLGDAYYNQPKDVTEAVQVMRQKAQQAGNLKTSQQQVVTTEGSTIIIEPASTEVVYVPEYNSTVVYVEESSSSSDSGEAFAAGVAVGVLAGYEWGWSYWGYSWGGYRYGYGYGVQINCSGSNKSPAAAAVRQPAGRTIKGRNLPDRLGGTLGRVEGTGIREAKVTLALEVSVITTTVKRRKPTRKEEGPA